MDGYADVLVANAIVLALAMTLLWVMSIIVRDVSIVDIFWGLGFVVVAWVSFAAVDGEFSRQLVFVLLTSLWGLRLSTYLAWRNLGEDEDYRYAQMRERWGAKFPLVSLGTVFLLQGALIWIVSLPIQAGQVPETAGGLIWLDYVGIGFWGVGLFFETVGDAQLARFKKDPANEGKVMDRGLWRYTRHPNYFGDFMVWWGLYLVALSTVDAWWTIVGPIVMSVLLMRISGVGLLEKNLKKRREGYQEYIEKTSAFFPRPPKETA